jgi:hypothetical protein
MHVALQEFLTARETFRVFSCSWKPDQDVPYQEPDWPGWSGACSNYNIFPAGLPPSRGEVGPGQVDRWPVGPRRRNFLIAPASLLQSNTSRIRRRENEQNRLNFLSFIDRIGIDPAANRFSGDPDGNFLVPGEKRLLILCRPVMSDRGTGDEEARRRIRSRRKSRFSRAERPRAR